MKRTIILLILFVIVNAGCCEQKSSNLSSAYIEKPHQNITVGEVPYEGNWLKSGLPKAGLKNLSVGEKAQGCFTAQSSAYPRYAYVLCDYDRYGKKGIYHDSYLAIETDSKVLLKDLSCENNGSYADIMYARDVDGDGTDEIILQQAVGMTGGAGQYRSCVFKVVEDRITEIFNSSTGHLYDTGFNSTLKDGFKLVLQNRFTGYEKTLDLSKNKQYIGVYFDINGNVVENRSLLYDSFKEFIPEDVDNDDIFEILCLQYVSLYSHTDYIGDAKSVLKFNANTQEFDIIKAEFIE